MYSMNLHLIQAQSCRQNSSVLYASMFGVFHISQSDFINIKALLLLWGD